MHNILAIDIGNTNIVFAVFGQDDLISRDLKVETLRIKTDADDKALFDCLKREGIDLNTIDKVIVSSVVEERNSFLRKTIEEYLDIQPLFLTSNDIDIPVIYDLTSDVGVDRLVTSYAGKILYGTPLIIVDLGTAITVEVVNQEKKYIGGMIFPGIDISLDALSKRTSKLPYVAITIPNTIIGQNTEDSIKSGIYNGLIGAINHFCELVVENLCLDSVNILITGGYSELFKNSRLKYNYIDKDLTIKGLKLIAGKIFR